MKTTQLTSALLLAAVFTLLGCDGGPSGSSTGASVASSPSAPAEAPRLANLSGDGKWPPPTTGTVTPAANLLAKNYVIVFDGSGSMADGACGESQRKIDSAKTALREFIPNIPADANVGLVVFDSQGLGERVALGTGAEHRNRFIREIDGVSANGGTPLFSSMKLGAQMLAGQAQRQFGYGEYHLVVVTDGEANPGESPSDVVAALARTPVMMHTIGFCIDSSHSLNKKGVVLYHEARDLPSLRKGLKEVLAESVRYDPTTFDGKK